LPGTRLQQPGGIFFSIVNGFASSGVIQTNDGAGTYSSSL